MAMLLKCTTIAIISLLVISAFCVNAKPVVSRPAENLTSAPPVVAGQWTASDRPYKDVEDQLAEQFSAGKSPQYLLQHYQDLAKANPKDPVAQFAWVCAGRGAAWVSSSDGSMPRYLLDTLTKNDPGNVREYTRYRFCLTDETDLVLPVQNAELIGGRLLASNPKDHWVRLSLINMLCATPEGIKKALPHALNWVQLELTNPKAHSSLAQVYFDLWEGSGRKNVQLGNNSIREYQAYLKLAPANDHFRGHAQSFISHIQQAHKG